MIDDHSEMLGIVRDILEPSGYVVSTLSGNRTSLEEVVATRPDLVILDLVFAADPHQLTGWEYLRLIRTHRILRFCPVLVCSADLRGLRDHQAELEADDLVRVLEKPFTIDEIEKAVAELLSQTPTPDWADEHEIVLLADADARLVGASDAALRLLGLTHEQLTRLGVADIVAQDVAWTSAEWKRYRGERFWEGPVTLRDGDGGKLPARAVARILLGAGREWHLSWITLATDSIKPDGTDQSVEQESALA